MYYNHVFVPQVFAKQIFFLDDGQPCKAFDVGGSRNERKKWIHCFSDVTGLLVVFPLSAYDLKLYEDDETNRVEEALNLFDELCNSRWFRKTQIFVLLNKSDQLAEKIRKVPLSVCFPDYGGKNTFEDAVDYIRLQLEARMHDHKQIYFYILNATDIDNTRTVMNSIFNEIVRKRLADAQDSAGLL